MSKYNPAYWRKYHLTKYYGLTEEAYDGLLRGQGGSCAICGSTKLVGRKKRLEVDHDHRTGKVRGILCQKCNTGLGMLTTGDDPIILARLVKYLESYRDS